jgi:hypothetical protein
MRIHVQPLPPFGHHGGVELLCGSQNEPGGESE